MANKFVENVCSSDQTIYIRVTDHTPYYVPSETKPMDGVVRTSQKGFEYYDAGVGDWFPLPGSQIDIELAPHVTHVLDWAYRKMEEEKNLDAMVAKYPAFAKAKDNFELMKAMVKNEMA